MLICLQGRIDAGLPYVSPEIAGLDQSSCAKKSSASYGDCAYRAWALSQSRLALLIATRRSSGRRRGEVDESCVCGGCVCVDRCAISTTVVVPLSDGLKKVTHQGERFVALTSTLRTQAVAEATANYAPKSACVTGVKENSWDAREQAAFPAVFAQVANSC